MFPYYYYYFTLEGTETSVDFGSILEISFQEGHKSAVDYYYEVEWLVDGITDAANGTLVAQAGNLPTGDDSTGLPPNYFVDDSGRFQYGQLGSRQQFDLWGDSNGTDGEEAGTDWGEGKMEVGIVSFFARPKDGNPIKLTVVDSDDYSFRLEDQIIGKTFDVDVQNLGNSEQQVFNSFIDVEGPSDSLIAIDLFANPSLIAEQEISAQEIAVQESQVVSTVVFTTTIYRETILDSLTGFYLIERSSGDVVYYDDASMTMVKPPSGAWSGSLESYQKAVRNHHVWEEQIANMSSKDFSDSFEVAGNPQDYALVPYIIVNGATDLPAAEKIMYLPGETKNADGFQHARLMGINTFGFEDLDLTDPTNDFDFDDMIVQVTTLNNVGGMLPA